MPRDVCKPLNPEEQRFTFHFAREGFHEERMSVVERKARLKKGAGAFILRRQHVQRDLAQKKAMVDLEQARLIARDQNRAAEKEDARQQVTLDKLEKKLDELLALDPETHGALVHEVIKTGLVYAGVVRAGRLERVPPIRRGEDEAQGQAESIYRSVFAGLRQDHPAGAEAVEAAPLMPEDPAVSVPPAEPLPKPPLPRPPKPPVHAEKPSARKDGDVPEIEIS